MFSAHGFRHVDVFLSVPLAGIGVRQRWQMQASRRVVGARPSRLWLSGQAPLHGVQELATAGLAATSTDTTHHQWDTPVYKCPSGFPETN